MDEITMLKLILEITQEIALYNQNNHLRPLTILYLELLRDSRSMLIESLLHNVNFVSEHLSEEMLKAYIQELIKEQNAN